ncbi:hypothetical protein L0P10_19585, partial [Eggerthella lenta]|nr:hypothetical protein [Eggerthella lenta]
KTGSFWRLADNPESMQEPDFYDCLTVCLVKKVWLGGLKLPTIGRFFTKSRYMHSRFILLYLLLPFFL